MTSYPITNQRELRRQFWQGNPDLSRRTGRDGDYLTDTRVAFCDYVDYMCRDGQISPELAARVTL